MSLKLLIIVAFLKNFSWRYPNLQKFRIFEPIFTKIIAIPPHIFIKLMAFFPPNTIIPYHTFIFLEANVHPILLFHTLRLLDSLEYSFLVKSYARFNLQFMLKFRNCQLNKKLFLKTILRDSNKKHVKGYQNSKILINVYEL